MDILALVARLTLDKSQYEQGLNEAETEASSIGGRLGKALGGVGKAVGTAAKVTAAGITAGSAAVGILTKQAVEGYSNYEQLSGGVKKLFGDAYDDVMKYASESYKTAGVSANQYMEQATGFAAALINSLGGDTKEAAHLADIAMQTMSDNVNTFGSDMSSVQTAFQGFSKQNYTMLDNLKLGYGGTKEEMSRLIADAAKAKDAQEELGLSVDGTSMSFDNIVKAIQVVQYEQGIAGTTSKEAATTIEGSLAMVKGAWDNLIAGFANPDADMDKLMDNLIVAIIGDKKGEGLLNQLLPAIERALDGIGKFLEKAAPIIAQYLPGLMEKILPSLISAATSLVAGLISALPTILQLLINQIPFIVNSIGNAIIGVAPLLIEGGKSLMKALYDGLIQAFPQIKPALDGLKKIFETAFKAISKIVGFFKENFETIKGVVVAVGGAIAGVGLVSMIAGIAGAISTVAGAVGGLISALSMIKSFAGLVSVISTLAGGPLVLIPALIGAVVAAFIYLWNTSEEFRNFWIGLWESVKTVISVVCDAVLGIFTTIGEIITAGAEFIGGIIETIVSGIQTAWETIKSVVDIGLQILGALFENAVTILTIPWQFLWENFGGIITEKWESFKSTISNALGVISGTISNVWNVIATTLSNILGKISKVISDNWNNVRTKISSVLNTIKNTISNIWNAISTTISNVLNTIKSVIDSGWNAAKDTVSSVLDTISGVISNVWNSIHDTVSGIIDNISSGIESGFNSILDAASNIFESVKDAITGPIETAKETVGNIIDSIKDLFDFEWKLPDIELPHLSVWWEDLGPISIPHVSVDWYAKAYDNPYLFTSPTVVGGMGFGDRAGEGGEMVYGHDNLMDDIRSAVNSEMGRSLAQIYSLLSQYLPEIAEQNIVLNDGTLVGALAPAMDARMGIIAGRRKRGN